MQVRVWKHEKHTSLKIIKVLHCSCFKIWLQNPFTLPKIWLPSIGLNHDVGSQKLTAWLPLDLDIYTMVPALHTHGWMTFSFPLPAQQSNCEPRLSKRITYKHTTQHINHQIHNVIKQVYQVYHISTGSARIRISRRTAFYSVIQTHIINHKLWSMHKGLNPTSDVLHKFHTCHDK